MRQRVIPILAPVPKPRYVPGRSYRTKSRGAEVLNSSILNKGTAFTAIDRKALGFTGLLPPEISTLDAQAKLAYIQYDRLPDTLSRTIYRTALQARKKVLYYRLFSEHLREMMPALDDVALSSAAQRHPPESGPSQGVYLSIDHIDAMEEAFANLGAGAAGIDLILAADGEQILGIGDGGMSVIVTVRHPGAPLLPHIDDLSTMSMTVAAAVAEAAVAERVSGAPVDDIVQQVQDAMWQPEYCEIQAV